MEDPLHDARYYVDVVAEAGELLRAFTPPPYRFTLTELSLATGLSKNKTFGWASAYRHSTELSRRRR